MYNNNNNLIILSILFFIINNDIIINCQKLELKQSTTISSSSSSSSSDDNIENYYLNNICSFTNSINDDDIFELFYLQAPLMEAQYGELFAEINAYHSGIGLTSPKLNITADYYAGPTIVNSIFPVNITLNNVTNDYSIQWDTFGIVAVTNQLNSTYWNKRQLMMFDITGYQVKQFLAWIPVYNQSNPVYNLFNIQNPNTSLFYQNSSICDDFVWQSFNTFYQLGAQVIQVQSNPNRDDVTLYTLNPPQLVDQSNTTEMNEIAEFYLNMKEIANFKNETLQEIVIKILGIFEGIFYLYNDGQYYKMDLYSNKPIDFSYKPSPMPNGNRNSSTILLLSNCLFDSISNKSFIEKHEIIIIIISILIIIICTISLYLTIGIIINKIKGKSGFKLIPNYSLWSKLCKSKKRSEFRKPLLYDTENHITIQ